eukprot:scaffold217572_cov20-Prasinocladus_malaysianus.AAC.1
MFVFANRERYTLALQHRLALQEFVLLRAVNAAISSRAPERIPQVGTLGQSYTKHEPFGSLESYIT